MKNFIIDINKFFTIEDFIHKNNNDIEYWIEEYIDFKEGVEY